MILNMHPSIEVPGSNRVPFRFDDARWFVPQVEEYLRGLGDPRTIARVALTTKPVAPLFVPAIEALRQLPTLICYGYGEDAHVLGELNLDEYRHRVVRPRRVDLNHGEPFPGVTVLDGTGRNLMMAQRAGLADLLGRSMEAIRVRDVQMGHVDFSCPERGMIDRLLALGFTVEDWTSGRISYLPPGNGIVAAVMATTIYGLAGSWPKTIRLARVSDGTFRVAEVIDLQALYVWWQRYAAEIARGGAPVAVPRPLFDRTLAAIGDDTLRAELEALRR